ncbi:MAG: hypothetical protein JXR49_17635 [Acidobacteria bacterium]|nr:hypothetical protein [Acidobacteriota bacterium]
MSYAIFVEFLLLILLCFAPGKPYKQDLEIYAMTMMDMEYDSLKRLGMTFPKRGLNNPRWLNPSSIQFDRVEMSENYERHVSKGAVLATLESSGWNFMDHDREKSQGK